MEIFQHFPFDQSLCFHLCCNQWIYPVLSVFFSRINNLGESETDQARNRYTCACRYHCIAHRIVWIIFKTNLFCRLYRGFFRVYKTAKVNKGEIGAKSAVDFRPSFIPGSIFYSRDTFGPCSRIEGKISVFEIPGFGIDDPVFYRDLFHRLPLTPGGLDYCCIVIFYMVSQEQAQSFQGRSKMDHRPGVSCHHIRNWIICV